MLGPQEEVCLGCSRQRAPSVLKSYTESQLGQASVATAHLALQRSDEPAPSQTHHLRNRQALKQSVSVRLSPVTGSALPWPTAVQGNPGQTPPESLGLPHAGSEGHLHT